MNGYRNFINTSQNSGTKQNIHQLKNRQTKCGHTVGYYSATKTNKVIIDTTTLSHVK